MYATVVGFTRSGDVTGAYQMADGTIAEDASRSYFVVLDDSRLDELKDVLRRFKAKTTQEAIYFEVQYNTVVDFL